MKLIKNGTIYTMEDETCFVGDLLIDKGKIIEIKKNIPENQNMEIIDASGKNVFPGFIDAHCTGIMPSARGTVRVTVRVLLKRVR